MLYNHVSACFHVTTDTGHHLINIPKHFPLLFLTDKATMNSLQKLLLLSFKYGLLTVFYYF